MLPFKGGIKRSSGEVCVIPHPLNPPLNSDWLYEGKIKYNLPRILYSRHSAASMEFPTSQSDFHNPTNLLLIKVFYASVRKTSSM